MKTLYKSKWILPKSLVIIEDGGFLVEDGVILDVLDPKNLRKFNSNNCEIVDFGNSVLTPGFINLHVHLQYTEIGDKKSKSIVNRIIRLFLYLKKFFILKFNKKSFVSWIINLIIEYICWTREEKQESFKEGLKQVLLSGTTCVAQLSAEEAYLEILKSSPVRSAVFFEIYADSEQSADINFEKFRQVYEKHSQSLPKGMITGISPHAFYNVHEKLWQKIVEYSEKHNVLIHTHFAESPEEMEWLKTGHSDINKLHKLVGVKKLQPYQKGLDPVLYLKNLNLPFENVILAHINQLEEKDYKELADLGVSVAHCPRSNIILHNKTLDILKLLQYLPSRTGIGTDSLYSNYDLNILNEARVIFDSGAGLFTVLDMLTINAARILRMDNIIGSLEKGKQADFLVFRLKENENYRNFINKNSPDSVYISGKTIVNGQVLQSESKMK